MCGRTFPGQCRDNEFHRTVYVPHVISMNNFLGLMRSFTLSVHEVAPWWTGDLSMVNPAPRPMTAGISSLRTKLELVGIENGWMIVDEVRVSVSLNPNLCFWCNTYNKGAERCICFQKIPWSITLRDSSGLLTKKKKISSGLMAHIIFMFPCCSANKYWVFFQIKSFKTM